MRVALVHDWLVAHRGGEAVLLELARMFPEAPIFTLVLERDNIHPDLAKREIRTSYIQKLPGAPASFRRYLPLFPSAIEQLDVSGFDLVISTSHCVAKGIHAGQASHITYVHTPMRYAWGQRSEYAPKGITSLITRPMFEAGAAWLRNWDRRSAQRPTQILANSKYVADRIQHSWGRSAQVVYPPVDTDFFTPSASKRQSYLAVVGAQVGYKNNSLAVEFATATDQELRVIGDGPAIEQAREKAGPTVVFEGHVSQSRLREIYREARALLFCGVEDFGIVPVEAISCGCPVLAYGEGGALETVIEQGDGMTGILFRDRTVAGLQNANHLLTQQLEAGRFQPESMHRHALRFSRASFEKSMRHHIEKCIAIQSRHDKNVTQKC